MGRSSRPGENAGRSAAAVPALTSILGERSNAEIARTAFPSECSACRIVVAAIDTTYAALGVAGAAGILSTLLQLRLALGLLGAAVLVLLGARTM